MMTAATPMTLSSLLQNTALAPLDGLMWQRLVSDSRAIQAGDVFVALDGARVSGRDFIEQSIAGGAVAVIVEGDEQQLPDFADKVPVIAVKNLAAQLSELASRSLHYPSAALDVIGVTGTNGKTTTTLLIAQLLELLHVPAAVIGTLGFGRAGAHLTFQQTGFTTPDAIATQVILQHLKNDNVRAVAMEVSSHSLAQHRVAGVAFNTAVFTNLSHDHLDYHGDLKAYGKAKARLLKAKGLAEVVINRDDQWARSLIKKVSDPMRLMTYSLKSTKADVRFENLEFSSQGMSGTLITPVGSGEFSATLLGDFNAGNLLAAVSVALLRGFAFDDILLALRQLKAAPGRMQQVCVDDKQDVQVLVDYAHTPDALEKALRASRFHTGGQLWCVFGCGGERDREKRPVMGRVAEKSADFVIVTNDNPRGENPATIASDILQGMRQSERCLTIADRAKAIELAVQQAHAGDLVLIAGKGHEYQQVFADRTVSFNDVLEAEQALRLRMQKSVAQRGDA
ncbi:MAG TPA: UDP-N-acetylmuramoyl-L-alanyl-D-glutamate--2,6-diaminopimelate ligase [Cellvibrionaceae bacterium]